MFYISMRIWLFMLSPSTIFMNYKTICTVIITAHILNQYCRILKLEIWSSILNKTSVNDLIQSEFPRVQSMQVIYDTFTSSICTSITSKYFVLLCWRIYMILEMLDIHLCQIMLIRSVIVSKYVATLRILRSLNPRVCHFIMHIMKMMVYIIYQIAMP